MERLLAQIGLTYLSVLAIVFYLNENWTIVLGAVFLLVAVLFLSIKKYRKTIYLPVMAFVAIFACVVNLSYTTFVYDKTVENYSDKKALITAVMIEEPYKYYDSYWYRFECTSVDSQEADFKFIASHSELLNIDVFDEIEIEAEFSASSFNNNISDGYFIEADFSYEYPQFTVTKPERKPLYFYAVKLRQSIREFLKSNLSADAYPLCSALFLGDKYLLPYELKEDFTHAGVSHAIVVSGMHFSIIFGFLFVLANKWYRYRRYILVFSIALAILYMALTGFTPSVFRSGVMMLFCAVGFIISREPYSPISLGVAGLLITWIQGPYIAGDVGLILSFATTFSIIVVAPQLQAKFYNRILNTRCSKFVTGLFKIKSKKKTVKRLVSYINKIPRLLLSMLCVNISAYLAALPLSIIFFHSVPTLSIISGFILYFPIEALLLMILLMVVTAFLPFLTVAFAFLINLISCITISIVEWFANIPFSYVDVTYKYVCIWVLAYIVLFGLLWLGEKKHRFQLFTILMTVLFLVGYISANLFSYDVSALYVYEVADGIAVLYSSREISAVLNIESKSYSMNSVVDEIKSTVSDLDFVAAVNNTSYSSNSVKSLSEVFAIDTVLLYDTKRTVSLSDDVLELVEIDDSQTVEFSDGSIAEYIMADEKYIVYFTCSEKSVLIVPEGFDVTNIEEKYRNADTIILSDCPENFELLSCDTLIVNEGGTAGHNLMKLTRVISNRVLFTDDGDIKIVI